MKETQRDFFEAHKRKDENNKGQFHRLLKHVEEIKDFFKSRYMSQTREKDFGFVEIEQFKDLHLLDAFQESIIQIENQEETLKIVQGNNLEHILGNSITITAGAYAKRYEDGKYSSGRFSLPIDTFKKIKVEVSDMLVYIKELSEDKNLILDELGSRDGYLGKFVKYLKCNLPTQTTEFLKLFIFFRMLGKGKMTKEIFEKQSKCLEKYLDNEKIEKELEENAEGFLKL